MAEKSNWTVDIVFTEEGEHTRADAVIRTDDFEIEAEGTARRNPSDPEVPVIGEEIAAARALSHLAHGLLDRAAYLIEQREGHPVRIHA